MKTLTDVQGIGDATAKVLMDHGIRSAKALAKADIAKLIDLPGFGEKRAQAVIRAAMELAGSPKHPVSDKKKLSKKKKTGKGKKHKKKEKNNKKRKKQEKKAPKDKKNKNKKTKGKKGKGKKK